MVADWERLPSPKIVPVPSPQSGGAKIVASLDGRLPSSLGRRFEFCELKIGGGVVRTYNPKNGNPGGIRTRNYPIESRMS